MYVVIELVILWYFANFRLQAWKAQLQSKFQAAICWLWLETTSLASEDQHFFGVSLDFHNGPDIYILLRSAWPLNYEAKGKTLDG